ncbi:hypothetical protein EV356DRAFT_72224 [Viridothelium virens]|uniref:CFEM domain-containing protein n=1 Tax=Viridothelium virens TaxID=1048519 RepID=A0A6A6HG06_VIRVR|nr:hypothetical protein EV356DRAFT_72224 [Viridothelium virens]
MQFSITVLLSFIPAFIGASPATTFPLSEWKEYHCLTLDKYLTEVPPCSVNCLRLGLDGYRDGCAPDDFVCHCAHTQAIDDLLVPCITGANSPNATCTDADIGQLQSVVTNLCAFYNATQTTNQIRGTLAFESGKSNDKAGKQIQ